MSANKYLCVFWRQTNSISLVHFFTNLALSTTIYRLTSNHLKYYWLKKRFTVPIFFTAIQALKNPSLIFKKTHCQFRISYHGAKDSGLHTLATDLTRTQSLSSQGAQEKCGVWWEENKSNILWSYLSNISSFSQLSASSACLVAIAFTSEYETHGLQIITPLPPYFRELNRKRINYEWHPTIISAIFLLYVLNDYTCIHITLPQLRL